MDLASSLDWSRRGVLVVAQPRSRARRTVLLQLDSNYNVVTVSCIAHRVVIHAFTPLP